MKIKEARKRAALSQDKTARLSDIGLRHYVKIEKGETMPGVDVALRICRVLSVDPFDIDEWNKGSNPVPDERTNG